MKKNKTRKIAIVVDELTRLGGAEKVLKTLLSDYPDATVFTSYSDSKFVKKEFPKVKVKNSFIQYIPFSKQFNRELLLLHPLAYRSFSFIGYDLVISISAGFGKFIKPWFGTKHILYCLTPPRFLWLKDSRSTKKSKKFSYKIYSLFMGTFLEKIWQNWDRKAARKATKVVTISETVRERAQEVYGVDSEVIYPPVDVEKIKLNEDNDSREKWFLYHGRLERYKGVHLAIAACAMTHTPLKISGVGNELDELQQMVLDYNAKGLVKFLGRLEDEEVYDLMYKCKGLIFPVKDEDFGIVPVEANAAGAPVIAFKSGGSKETVSEDHPKSGIFF
ncbi:MAG TPA: glycosyltransferase, partial [Candidatus Dojkabacteria bacterium]|nr:glycosyltransferase [Candidatus Dojkabacteria bacterium]